MAEYKYEYYWEGNRCFVGEFVEKRDDKEKGKIAYYLRLLEQRGQGLTKPYAEKISKYIYEMKPSFWNTEMRLLYFWEGNTALFVHAVIKKTRKTPQGAIETAEKRRKRYYQAKDKK